MLELNKIYCMDAIDFMKQLDNKSVNMILCDLPYQITGNSWDIEIPIEDLWLEFNRIVKDNGNIILTSFQPFTSKLVTSNIKNFKFEIIWEKSNFTNPMLAKIQMLRIHESILIFTNADSSKEFGKYLKKKRTEKGISLRQIGELCNERWYHRGGTFFFETGLSYPSREQYQVLKNVLELDNRFDDLFKRPIFNPQGIIELGKLTRQGERVSANYGGGERAKEYTQEFTNYPKSILKIKSENGLHPTQKPVELFEYLIKTFSNEGDIVLDCVVGSGTTAVACQRTNRRFICNDNNETYVKIAKERLSQKPLLFVNDEREEQ